MKNYAVFEAGPMEGWDAHVARHPRLAQGIKGKLFLKEALGLTGMEVSLNKMPARSMVPFAHRHNRNEEVYLFIAGEGEFMVDGEVIPVKPGTLIRVAPAGARTWRNRSEQDLYYVVIQAPAGGVQDGGISDGAPLDGRPRWPR